jgi:hypothetical protein
MGSEGNAGLRPTHVSVIERLGERFSTVASDSSASRWSPILGEIKKKEPFFTFVTHITLVNTEYIYSLRCILDIRSVKHNKRSFVVFDGTYIKYTP